VVSLCACPEMSERLAEKSHHNLQTPRPKWEVLSVLNYVVLIVFTTSLTFTAMNYRYFVPDEISGKAVHSIFPMLILWCICVVSAWARPFSLMHFLNRPLRRDLCREDAFRRR
jgi:uncharacterized membrane protein